MAPPTKAYPLAGVFVPGTPHVVTEAATKAEAEALEATGAFTLNANHPDRVPADAVATTTPAPAAEEEV